MPHRGALCVKRRDGRLEGVRPIPSALERSQDQGNALRDVLFVPEGTVLLRKQHHVTRRAGDSATPGDKRGSMWRDSSCSRVR